MPGAFTTSARSGTGSIKKLNINRNLNTRRSLFDGDLDETPKQGGLRKKVSFDDAEPSRNGFTNGERMNGASKALVPIDQPAADSRPKSNGAARAPEMEQVDTRGKELATVPEDSISNNTAPLKSANEMARINRRDMKPGDYWMEPSREEIESLPRDKRRIRNFAVGREGVAKVTFSEVDLAEVDLSRILDDYVKLETRSATVYPDNTIKPPPGKGLNVPSTIVLDNCFPRSHGGAAPVFKDSGPKFEKHIARLKRIENTDFVSFDAKTGRWTFTVQHFTTYGLDYDEDESMMSATVEYPTPTPLKRTPNGIMSDASIPSPPESDVDDTFDFKKSRKIKEIPGQFDDVVIDDEEMEEEPVDVVGTPQSFLGDRSAGSSDAAGDDTLADISESESVMDQEMAGSFPMAPTAEHTTAFNFSQFNALQPSEFSGTPSGQLRLDFGADWTQQLQRTVSPRKQDRQALRDGQTDFLKGREEEDRAMPLPAENGRDFNTSIDLMHSLFGQTTQQNRGVKQVLTQVREVRHRVFLDVCF